MRVHKSKIDFWLAFLILGMSVFPIALALMLGGPIWPSVILCGGLVVFMVWLYVATRYVVTKDEVTIHAGLYKVIIPISSITSIIPSKSVLASPAFSLDRLEISYGDNSKMLISPRDKNELLADIGWQKG